MVKQIRPIAGLAHRSTREVPKMATEVTGPGTPDTASDATTKTDQERDEMASKLVERFALWSGAAGLIPIPVVDVATVAGIQLQLLRRLSEIYGAAFSDNRGKWMIAALLRAVVAAASGKEVAGVRNALPIIGTAAGALTMSGVSAGATYAIGKVFIQHFASGGTLLDFDPPDYREFLKAQKDKWTSKTARSSATTKSDTSTHGDPGRGDPGGGG